MKSLPWHQIETVLLDMDGTILDLHFDNYFWLTYLPEVYAETHKLSFNEAKQKLTHQFDAIRGTLNWYCLDYWSDTLNIDIVALKKTIGNKVAFRPQALEFLQFLTQQQKRVYLVTNAHQKSLEIKMLNNNFHEYFDELISSHEFGAPKEEQTFWVKLQQRIEFDKETTLFIDDSLSILQSAQRFGIKYVLGIAQPDTQQAARPMDPFYAIEQFKDIMKLPTTA